jgi:hypothetical protein
MRVFSSFFPNGLSAMPMGRCTPPEKEWTIVEHVNSVEFNKFKMVVGEEREPKKK